MSIRMMIYKPDVNNANVYVKQYPGWDEEERGPLYMEETFAGCVLCTREYNGPDDSDFYAVVWDEEQGRCRAVEYASTRGWTYPNSASVDATSEAVFKAKAWLEGWLRERIAEEMLQDAKEVEVGKTVEATKRGKVYQGIAVWCGEKSYNGSYPVRRVGIEMSDRKKEFFNLDKVKVVAPEDLVDSPEIERLIARTLADIDGGQWSLFAIPFSRGRVFIP